MFLKGPKGIDGHGTPAAGPFRPGVLVAVLILTVLVLPAAAAETKVYDLYRPRNDRPALAVEKRAIPTQGGLTDRVRTVLEALIAGPDGESPDMEGIRLRQVFVTQGGAAYVDLEPDPAAAGRVGVGRERLIVWSLVNTVALNFPEIHETKILVGGGEADTLFGHVDLSRPLLPDPDLVQ